MYAPYTAKVLVGSLGQQRSIPINTIKAIDPEGEWNALTILG